MTGRIAPDNLDPLASADADGLYVVQKVGKRFREWFRLKTGGPVSLVLDSTAHTATITSSAVSTRLLPLTTVINGVPELVWDANNELVFTEVSA